MKTQEREAVETACLAKCLPHKHTVLSLDPQYACKIDCRLSTRVEAGSRGRWISRVC